MVFLIPVPWSFFGIQYLSCFGKKAIPVNILDIEGPGIYASSFWGGDLSSIYIYIHISSIWNIPRFSAGRIFSLLMDYRFIDVYPCSRPWRSRIEVGICKICLATVCHIGSEGNPSKMKVYSTIKQILPEIRVAFHKCWLVNLVFFLAWPLCLVLCYSFRKCV